jgi:hypothetical protein
MSKFTCLEVIFSIYSFVFSLSYSPISLYMKNNFLLDFSYNAHCQIYKKGIIFYYPELI